MSFDSLPFSRCLCKSSLISLSSFVTGSSSSATNDRCSRIKYKSNIWRIFLFGAIAGKHKNRQNMRPRKIVSNLITNIVSNSITNIVSNSITNIASNSITNIVSNSITNIVSNSVTQ